jgi:hypothetical protein
MDDLTRKHDDVGIDVVFRDCRPDITPAPGCKERVRARLLAAIESKATRTGGKRRWHFPRSRLFRLCSVMAAAILIVLAGWFLLMGGVGTASADFAGMLRRVREAKTVAYELIVRTPGRPEERAAVQMSTSGRSRTEWSDGKISIFDGRQRRALALYPSSKRAVSLVSSARDQIRDPLERLRQAGESEGKYIGRAQCDQRQVELYRISQPQVIVQLWVDPKGELPARIEIDMLSETGKVVQTLILAHLQWNLPLDDSLFALDVPPGYVLAEKGQNPSEADLVALLRMCAESSGGMFPGRLDAKTCGTLFQSHFRPDTALSDAAGESLTAVDLDEEAKEHMRSCLRGLALVQQARDSGVWQYTGAGVKLGDAASKVCSWSFPGEGTRRAVFGDLQIKDVPEESTHE